MTSILLNFLSDFEHNFKKFPFEWDQNTREPPHNYLCHTGIGTLGMVGGGGKGDIHIYSSKMDF